MAIGAFIGQRCGPSGEAGGLTIGDVENLADVLSPVLTLPETPAVSDTLKGLLDETAMSRSGSPDSDAWGDAWVNRNVLNLTDNHGNETTMQFSAVTAATRHDAYCEISFVRFVGFVAGAGTKTLDFRAVWPSVIGNPNATILVDFQTSTSRPWSESAVNANAQARFTSTAPFTQRTFTATQDGQQRTHVVTFTSDEMTEILGKWLLIQWTVADLTLGDPFGVVARESVSDGARINIDAAFQL